MSAWIREACLPDSDVKCISAEEDFNYAWPKERGYDIDLAEVCERAKASPIEWTEELQNRLLPVTPGYKFTCRAWSAPPATSCCRGTGLPISLEPNRGDLFVLQSSDKGGFFRRTEWRSLVSGSAPSQTMPLLFNLGQKIRVCANFIFAQSPCIQIFVLSSVALKALKRIAAYTQQQTQNLVFTKGEARITCTHSHCGHQ
jgi:hypothetical protein